MFWTLLVACADPADRWLATVARGDDAEAFARLDVTVPPPGGFDVVRFRKRVDRIGLPPAVTWTREGAGRREGSFVVDGRTVPIALVVRRGRISDVEVDGVPLVPVQTYFVSPDATPVTDLVIPDLAARPGLDVTGTSEPGTLTVNARCRVGQQWVANATAGRVDGPFALRVRVPEGWPCQLGIRLVAPGVRREAVVCASPEVRPGPCSPAPDPTGPPVEASAIEAAWDAGGGLSVDYHLRANVPQPAAGAFESASVTTTLTCPGGKRPVTHVRPLTDEWLEPGVERVLGSPMIVHAAGRPCGLRLDYVRDDLYDRLAVPLFDGCVDAAGDVRPGPC